MTSEPDINALEGRIARLESTLIKISRTVRVLVEIERRRRESLILDAPDQQEPAGTDS